MDSSYRDLILKNTKTKIYPDGSTNTTYCNRYIFTDKKILEEYAEEIERDRIKLDEEFEIYREMYGDSEFSKNESERDIEQNEIRQQIGKDLYKTTRERDDSLKRARDKCFDIARLNTWKYFLTITFNGSEYDYKDPDFVMKKIRSWLMHRVSRDGLKYLLIPEHHKKGGIHCHALVNECLNVVDSGTRLVKGYPKPVKLETIKQKRYEVLRTVYNVPKWKYGYSTAIEIDNSRAFAFYITKYITKGNKKIFGKYYWSSRNCNREPEIVYTNTNFNDVPKTAISKPYTSVKYKYRQNCDIVPNFEELASKFDDIGDFLNYIYSDEYKKEVEKYEQ